MFERVLGYLKISMLAGVCLAMTVPAHSALIHQYVFAGNVDDQGTGGVDGTLVGGGATASGGVLQLDGTAWVAFGSNFLVPTTGDYSVLLFAQFDYAGGIHEFISQGNSGGPGFYIGPYGTEMRVSDNYGWTATPAFSGDCGGVCTGIASPLDGAWHHYALVVTGGNAEFFIDGISRGTRGGFGIGGGNPTLLGSQFGGNSELFKGQMSDVRIYDTALTGAEVAAISTEDFGVPEPASVTLLAGALVAMALRARRSGVARRA